VLGRVMLGCRSLWLVSRATRSMRADGSLYQHVSKARSSSTSNTPPESGQPPDLANEQLKAFTDDIKSDAYSKYASSIFSLCFLLTF
jgi:hypothetical protein